LNRNVRLQITRTSSRERRAERLSRPAREEYLSNDGSFLLQLSKDSEIRFGPAFYKAAIHGGDGKLVFNFGARRFFSYSGYGQSSNWTGPWSPTSPKVALAELLSTHAEPGTKITRMNILDMSRQTPMFALDFESLVTHRMWSSDGRLYLFRDVYSIYAYSVEQGSLIPLSTSKSPHCFLLKDKFLCVIETTGEVSLFEGYSGSPLDINHISEPGYTVKSAVIDEKKENISVSLKRQAEHGAEELWCGVTVQCSD
jgi:hypothetical protein